jgi:hypothetical protein
MLQRHLRQLRVLPHRVMVTQQDLMLVLVRSAGVDRARRGGRWVGTDALVSGLGCR